MVDLQCYSGKWYEIYVQNAPFEIGCDAATADYGLIPEGLSVLNICYTKDNINKIYKENRRIEGIAIPTKEPGELLLKFETGQTGLYKIFFTNYKISIVGNLQSNYLSILSRTPYIPIEKLWFYLNLSKKYGFKIIK